MSKKIPKVTTADVEYVLADATKVRDDMTSIMVRIGAGECERLDDPLAFARRCMAVSRVFTDATSFLLARAALQERVDE
jgi:hypothetical protein